LSVVRRCGIIGFITRDDLLKLAASLEKSGYGQYLRASMESYRSTNFNTAADAGQ
jgi:hypothetical protein